MRPWHETRRNPSDSKCELKSQEEKSNKNQTLIWDFCYWLSVAICSIFSIFVWSNDRVCTAHHFSLSFSLNWRQKFVLQGFGANEALKIHDEHMERDRGLKKSKKSLTFKCWFLHWTCCFFRNRLTVITIAVKRQITYMDKMVIAQRDHKKQRKQVNPNSKNKSIEL